MRTERPVLVGRADPYELPGTPLTPEQKAALPEPISLPCERCGGPAWVTKWQRAKVAEIQGRHEREEIVAGGAKRDAIGVFCHSCARSMAMKMKKIRPEEMSHV